MFEELTPTLIENEHISISTDIVKPISLQKYYAMAVALELVDIHKMIEYLQILAHKYNYIPAHEKLGIIYCTVLLDIPLATRYLMHAISVKTQQQNAAHYLGMLHQYYIKPHNYELMKYYYKISLNSHNAASVLSVINLAKYYQTIEIKPKFMVQLYRHAADKHNIVEAMMNLGYYFEVIAPNVAEMLRYYRAAAGLGNYESAMRLDAFLKKQPQ
jgi:TPR repeat protein